MRIPIELASLGSQEKNSLERRSLFRIITASVSRRCEERSDAAISPPVIFSASSDISKSNLVTPSLYSLYSCKKPYPGFLCRALP